MTYLETMGLLLLLKVVKGDAAVTRCYPGTFWILLWMCRKPSPNLPSSLIPHVSKLCPL